MSKIVKFPGQEEEPVPNNMLSFPDVNQRDAVKPVRRGVRQTHFEGRPSHANLRKRRSFLAWFAVVARMLFKTLRYAAAFCLQLALVIPLSVIGGFRWLICFFSMMALIGTWFVSTTMHGKLSPSEIHNVHSIYWVG